MVRPKVRKKIPAMDFMKAIGTNTHTLVSVDAMMATMISEVPLRAASFGSSPSLSFSLMFSSTTMEFVTSKPTDDERAIKDIMLMPKPAKYMSVKAPITEIGIVRAAISMVENLPRKRSNKPAVRQMAMMMFWITFWMDSFTASDLS